MFLMFQTLSNVQSGDAWQLQQSIENSESDLYVGLKSIIYTRGAQPFLAKGHIEFSKTTRGPQT